MLIRHLLQSFLEKDGYITQGFETGDELLTAFEAKPCDIVILDFVMPGTNGFEIGRAIKKISDVPIIMLTSWDAEEDYVRAIEQGIDVYLIKQPQPAILLVHVKTLLQRSLTNATAAMPPETLMLKYADITICLDSFQAFCGSKELALTRTEFSLLSYLMKNQKAPVSRTELLHNIWNYNSLVETRAADDAVKRLRRKLSNAGSNLVIETIWGHGFRLKIAAPKYSQKVQN